MSTHLVIGSGPVGSEAARLLALSGKDRAGTVSCANGKRPAMTLEEATVRGLQDHWAVHTRWMSNMTTIASNHVTKPDAWGHCLIYVVSSDGQNALLLSAGANGVIETPFDSLLAVGDDWLELIPR